MGIICINIIPEKRFRATIICDYLPLLIAQLTLYPYWLFLLSLSVCLADLFSSIDV